MADLKESLMKRALYEDFRSIQSEKPKSSTNVLIEKVVDVTGGTGRRCKYERKVHREKVRKALQRAGSITKMVKNDLKK